MDLSLIEVFTIYVHNLGLAFLIYEKGRGDAHSHTIHKFI